MRIIGDVTATTHKRCITLDGADPMDTPPYYRQAMTFIPDTIWITSYDDEPPQMAHLEGYVVKKDGAPGKARAGRKFDLNPSRHTMDYMIAPAWLTNLINAEYKP